jgi:hypothetical protein
MKIDLIPTTVLPALTRVPDLLTIGSDDFSTALTRPS